MRDIKPSKKEPEEYNLPPLNGDKYKDLELYEANIYAKNKRNTRPTAPPTTTSNKFNSKKLSGSNVPIANINVDRNETRRRPRKATPAIRKRPMFAKAPTKTPPQTPGKIRVGKGERKAMMALMGLLLIAAVIALMIFLPTATIDLKLRTAPLLVDDKILVGAVESTSNTVPGTSFFREISLAGSQKVAGTEVLGSKSKGEVLIVNRTLTEQKIKERSRLVTSDGVLFYMEKHAIVPPDSSVKVIVEAAEEGEAGNIEPQKLNFAGLDESSQQIVYAEVINALSGGTGETIAVVSAKDIETTKKEALKNAQGQAQQQIQSELPEGWALLEESWDMTMDSFASDQKEGDKIPVIDYKARITARVMGYEKAVFEEKMRTKLEAKMNDDYMLFPGPISYTQSVAKVDWENAESTVAIKVTHSTIPKISLDSLKEKLAGRTSDEAKEYLEGLPGVRSASMKLWPFWVKSIPRIEKRIEINLESEKNIK